MYKAQKKQLFCGHKKFRSWIFAGPKNPAKLDVAKSFAHWVLGHCSRSEDLLLIERSKFAIADAHLVHEFASIAPSRGREKVVIINSFENTTYSAASSLLKLLEEPKSCVVVILITDNLCNIMPTICSRCFILRFPPPTNNLNLEFIESVEGYKNALILMQLGILSKEISKSSDFYQNVLLALGRIIKFNHCLLQKEVFSGEFDILKKLKSDKIFWHLKYKEATKLIKICVEGKLDISYFVNALIS